MPEDLNPRKVVVVGAGVSGLTTAFLIREKGKEIGRDVEITILESKPYAGGSTKTDTVDGYICEWGPNGFLDNEPATFELIKLLGIENMLVKADERSNKRFIYHGGKMREVPLSPPKFLTSNIVPFLSKLRMACEIIVPRKKDDEDETVDSFGCRRLGKNFAKYLLDPMVSGIFAGNTKELSLKAVFPKMVEMEEEYGGLFKAMIAKKREAKKTGKISGGPAGPGSVLHTFKNGMGELTTMLVEKTNSELVYSSAAKTVEIKNNKFVIHTDGQSHEADDLILACPSFEASNIINNIDNEVSRLLGEIPFAPVDVVCHGYRRENIGRSVDGFGVLIPRTEGIRSLGCLWSDSIFPGQAPEGFHLLRTLLGGAHDPDIEDVSDDLLSETARDDLAKLIGLKNGPDFIRIFRHPKGIAQYVKGHLKRVAAAEKMEINLPGLYFTGVSYRGVSVNGCVKDAFRVANRFWEKGNN